MTEDKPLSMDFHSAGFIPRLPPPTKNSDGNRHRSFHVPACRTSAAALSAAVDSTKQQETAPPHRRNQVSRSAQAKRQPLFGREGSGGRGASLREAASPPSTPPTLRSLFGREREGGGFSTEKPPPSQSLYYFVFLVGSLLRRVASGGAACFMKAEGLMPTMFLNCLLK